MVERPVDAIASRAIVELGGERFACWWVDVAHGPTLKCGRCGRGILTAKLGDRCGVCTAKIIAL